MEKCSTWNVLYWHSCTYSYIHICLNERWDNSYEVGARVKALRRIWLKALFLRVPPNPSPSSPFANLSKSLSSGAGRGGGTRDGRLLLTWYLESRTSGRATPTWER